MINREATPGYPARDVTAELDMLQQSIGGEVPLSENGDVILLQDELQNHVSDAAAELMTGLHKRSEQLRYMETYESYRRLLGIVATDVANRVYETDTDTGSVKQAVFGYLQQSKRQMVALDYEKRLDKSRIERTKQWLAHHRKTRFVGAFAMSGATSSGLFLVGDELTPMLEFSRTQSTGIVGVTTLGLMLVARSALRSGPSKAGAALSKQFNSSLETYQIDDLPKRRKRSTEETVENLPARYAEKHLTIPFGAAAMYLTSYDASQTPGQFDEMIDGTLDITERSMTDSYGIKPAKLAKPPLYRRILGQK